ncbi:hypothetical protein [Fontivita pretiosa]|uniref:hypothetical protein n=1 Tax=Fontivita pretiosa TaxID=2989684 RepID=UPI003D167571
MQDASRTITRILVRAQTSDGEELAAVQCADGSYSITLNGKLLESLRWPEDQRATCLEFFERFSRTRGWEGT